MRVRYLAMAAALLVFGCCQGMAAISPDDGGSRRDAVHPDGGADPVRDAAAAVPPDRSTPDGVVGTEVQADAHVDGRLDTIRTPAWLFPPARPESGVVALAAAERLRYTPGDRGDVIPDFSIAGYHNSNVPIPDIPVAASLSPSGGDDTAAIQAAVDEVSAMPLGADGFRGAVLLKKGTYTLRGGIQITHSGVVIRGEGAGRERTVVVHDSTTQQDTFFVSAGALKTTKLTEVDQDYVAVGAETLRLTSVDGLMVGQKVAIFCKHTPKWIATIRVDFWKPEDFTLKWERTVVAIDRAKRQIRLDGPITSAIDRDRGLANGEVHTIVEDTRISQVGFEDLTFVATYDRRKKDVGGWYNDEQHAWRLFSFYNARDCWIRRTVGFFYGLGMVWAHGDTTRLTVEDSAMLDGVSLDTPSNHSGAKDYYFSFNGSESLGQRLYGRYGRHAFVMNGHGSSNVFLDAYSELGHIAQEPHQRWQHGSLYDNVYSDSMIHLAGSYVPSVPHGVKAANCALWNVVSASYRYWEPEIRLDRPLGRTGQNWVIGARLIGEGKGVLTPNEPKVGEAAHVEHTDAPVSPRSIFLAQLRDRLGMARVLQMTTATQRESPQALFDMMRAAFAQVPHFGDPRELSWMPAEFRWEAPGD